MALTRIIGLLALVVLLPGCKLSRARVSEQKHSPAPLAVQISSSDTFELNYHAGEIYSFGLSGTNTPTAKDHFEKAYKEIEGMLEGWRPLNFKRAVFVTENAYFDEALDYSSFDGKITALSDMCRLWMEYNPLVDYRHSDSLTVKKNAAIFHLMKDTIHLIEGVLAYKPYLYDFDNLHEKDWSSQFVHTLMKSGSGNCHSLPYLYKILANELHAKAYISLAPNHIYIKHRSEKWGWYNTELTSGEFPTDAWVKASGYITLEAIRSGIYMDTLGQKQSVALCAFDLAKGYEAKTGNASDGFLLKCCDLVLRHYPNHVGAILLKAETLRKNYDLLLRSGKKVEAQQVFGIMQELYFSAVTLGYREMPATMYRAWLTSAIEGNAKFVNQEINRTFQNR